MSKTALLVVALAAVGCKSESESLADLTSSLDAVRTEFNAHTAQPRFVTLLSAT